MRRVTPGMISAKIYLTAAYKVPFLFPREEENKLFLIFFFFSLEAEVFVINNTSKGTLTPRRRPSPDESTVQAKRQAVLSVWAYHTCT